MTGTETANAEKRRLEALTLAVEARTASFAEDPATTVKRAKAFEKYLQGPSDSKEAVP